MCDKEKKSLQKFTESGKPKLKIADTRDYLKTKYGIEKTDYDSIGDFINEKFATLKGKERDEFIKYMIPLMGKDLKNQVWEYNHVQITNTISKLIQEYGRMPWKSEIAEKTGLSRQTIHKHLKNYKQHPLYQIQLEKFGLMAEKVLARVFDFAVNGDVKAARLFFDVMGKNMGLAQSSYVQNNFVQINNIKLSQDKIKQLSPEKLSEIESIITDVILENDSE